MAKQRKCHQPDDAWNQVADSTVDKTGPGTRRVWHQQQVQLGNRAHGKNQQQLADVGVSLEKE